VVRGVGIEQTREKGVYLRKVRSCMQGES
jgi:hypothetical protein